MIIDGQRFSRDAVTGDPAIAALARVALRVRGAIRTVRTAAMAARPGTAGAAVLGRPLPRAIAVGAAGGAAAGVVERGLARRAGPGGRRLPSGFAAGRRRRRMRVTNTKALTRALRRVEGFSRVAKRVLKIAAPRARVRGFRFKRRGAR